MKTHLFSLLLVLLGGVTAHANLGETEAQIEARYGPAKGSRPGVGCYSKNYLYRSMFVTVIFIDGRGEFEWFHAKGRFSAADVKRLLAANARDGSQWYRPYEDGPELNAEPMGLSLLFDRREIARATVSDYAVIITSDKYERLHLHAGNDSWPSDRLNVPDDSPR